MKTAIPPARMYAASDEELAQMAATDIEAFAELYRRHLCSVFRHARAHVPGDAPAEDVTAQVFFKALSSASSFRGEGTYRAWLFQITQNAIATWYARNRRHGVAVETVPESPDPTPSPAAQAITQEERGLVWEAVATLPPAQREVVSLRYLKELTIDEIARRTRRTRGAVRILLHRARTNLRKGLEGSEVPT